MGESLAGDGEWLAGEAAADEVDALRVGFGEGAHFGVAAHVWPVPSENALAERVDLDLPADLPARALEAKVKAADAAE